MYIQTIHLKVLYMNKKLMNRGTQMGCKSHSLNLLILLPPLSLSLSNALLIQQEKFTLIISACCYINQCMLF